jgi:MFS family permease
MAKKQLLALFFSSLIIWIVGAGLLPLLPVYATQLGATPNIVGYYLAIVYSVLTAGTMVAGWLSDKLQQRKKLIIVAGTMGIPVVWLIGQAANIWQLTVLTAMLWFLGGMSITLVMILTGLFADKTKRGKSFGILSMTGPLGLIIAGLTHGPLADRWGYPIMFAVLSFMWALSPLIAILLEDKVVEPVQRDRVPGTNAKPNLGGMFFLLFSASILASVAVFIGRLGVSLTMNDLKFAATAISSTGAIGGAVALPIPPLIGWLSDRIGRKSLLALFYLGGSTGMLIIIVSKSLWHFWVASSLILTLTAVNRAVGAAFVSDLIQQESAGRGISLISSARWIGAVIGFAFAGFAFQFFGMRNALIMGALLPLLGSLLLIPIQYAEKEKEKETVII